MATEDAWYGSVVSSGSEVSRVRRRRRATCQRVTFGRLVSVRRRQR